METLSHLVAIQLAYFIALDVLQPDGTELWTARTRSAARS